MRQPLRILLLEGDSVQAGTCEVVLGKAFPGAEVTTVSSAADGISASAARSFDVVLVGTELADGHGLDALRALRAAHPTRSLIALLGRGSENLAATALRAGAGDYVQVADIAAGHLAERIEIAVARSRHDRRGTLLHDVQDELASETDVRQTLDSAAAGAARVLDATAVSIWAVFDGGAHEAHLPRPLAEAGSVVTRLFEASPAPGDVVVSLVEPDEADLPGFQSVAAGWAMGPAREQLVLLAARDEGAWDSEDLRWIELVARILIAATLRAVEFERSRTGTFRDVLTGLPERNEFIRNLETELERARRQGQQVALVLAQLDDFAPIRANESSAVVDAIVRETAGAVSRVLRRYDLPARTGVAQFAVMLPGADGVRAALVAERITRAVHSLELPSVARVTASVGVAAYPEAVDAPADLFGAAEEALLIAQHEGGDHVVSAPRRRVLDPPAGRW